jgi:Retroviral aspartyl protease
VIRARTTQICHIAKNNTLDVPVIFMSAKKLAAYEALLDSGATENFIDPRMVDKLGIGRVPMVNPRMVFNVDGTENQGGQVNHYCVLNILQGRKQSAQVFFITNLGNDRLIFGYPWLEEFAPQIDWRNRTILGPPVKLTTTGRSWKIKWAN